VVTVTLLLIVELAMLQPLQVDIGWTASTRIRYIFVIHYGDCYQS
jgi:hypothetical protein